MENQPGMNIEYVYIWYMYIYIYPILKHADFPFNHVSFQGWVGISDLKNTLIWHHHYLDASLVMEQALYLSATVVLVPPMNHLNSE